MNFCSECGSKLKKGNKNCTQCGAPIVPESTNKAIDVETPEVHKKAKILVVISVSLTFCVPILSYFINPLFDNIDETKRIIGILYGLITLFEVLAPLIGIALVIVGRKKYPKSRNIETLMWFYVAFLVITLSYVWIQITTFGNNPIY